MSAIATKRASHGAARRYAGTGTAASARRWTSTIETQTTRRCVGSPTCAGFAVKRIARARTSASKRWSRSVPGARDSTAPQLASWGELTNQTHLQQPRRAAAAGLRRARLTRSRYVGPSGARSGARMTGKFSTTPRNQRKGGHQGLHRGGRLSGPAHRGIRLLRRRRLSRVRPSTRRRQRRAWWDLPQAVRV